VDARSNQSETCPRFHHSEAGGCEERPSHVGLQPHQRRFSKECNGITFYLKTDKKPDFTVQIMVSGHDDPKASEQSRTWILHYLSDPSPADKSGHGMGGMGIQSNAKLTARDVCMTVWDDIDPNHFKKPGGKIE
jgi:hypothetical protein